MTKTDKAYELEQTNQGLQLVSNDKNHGSIHCDFLGGVFAHRLKYGGKYSQPLAKAIGLKSLGNCSVLDATAGLGADGMLLAAWGCQVTMLERNLLVFSLLQDGIQRAQKDEQFGKLDFSCLNIDAKDFLRDQAKKFAVIYLDPMFRPERRRAKQGKNMQALETILANEKNNIDGLLKLARIQARRRVVVKRAKNSPWLDSQAPSFSIKGEASRFDVYLVP